LPFKTRQAILGRKILGGAAIILITFSAACTFGRARTRARTAASSVGLETPITFAPHLQDPDQLRHCLIHEITGIIVKDIDSRFILFIKIDKIIYA